MLFIRPTIIREQDSYIDVSERKLDKFQQEQNTERSHADGQRIKENLNKALSDGQSLKDLRHDVSAFYAKGA